MTTYIETLEIIVDHSLFAESQNYSMTKVIGHIRIKIKAVIKLSNFIIVSSIASRFNYFEGNSFAVKADEICNW